MTFGLKKSRNWNLKLFKFSIPHSYLQDMDQDFHNSASNWINWLDLCTTVEFLLDSEVNASDSELLLAKTWNFRCQRGFWQAHECPHPWLTVYFETVTCHIVPYKVGAPRTSSIGQIEVWRLDIRLGMYVLPLIDNDNTWSLISRWQLASVMTEDLIQQWCGMDCRLTSYRGFTASGGI